MDRTEQAKRQEEQAQELFESGAEEAAGLVELLEKVKKPDQLPLFYAGGLRVIAKLLTGGKITLIYRTHISYLHATHLMWIIFIQLLMYIFMSLQVSFV